MKNICKLLPLLISLQLMAQSDNREKIPLGQWLMITGKDGNSIASEKAATGQYYLKTAFHFINETKYVFSLEEFEADGKKLRQVDESGTYSTSASQFTLQPKSSVTRLLDPSAVSTRTKSLQTTENSLSPAVYTWQLETSKSTAQNTLVITATSPGYREGIFPTKARSASTSASSRGPRSQRYARAF